MAILPVDDARGLSQNGRPDSTKVCIEGILVNKRSIARMKENKNLDFEKLEPHDRLKYEIAEELGLLEKVREGGWKALSSRETGRIGGMISRRRKALEKQLKERAD